MNSVFSKFKRILCVLLTIFTLTSLLPLTVSAQRDQDKILLKVVSSDDNPASGETITVTVKIANSASVRPLISAFQVGVKFSDSLFEFVSMKHELGTQYSDDAISVVFDNKNTVQMFYTYANPSGDHLNEGDDNDANRSADLSLFSFTLRVKDLSGSDGKTVSTFSVTDNIFYGNDAKKNNYYQIETKTPEVDTVNIWNTRPAILINSSEENAELYDDFVTLRFPSYSSAQILYKTVNGTEYKSETLATDATTFECKLNGTYVISVNYAGQLHGQTFTVNKPIKSIGVGANSIFSSYAIGEEPIYSLGKIVITYTDNSTIEIPMDDPDVKISGFDKSVAGEQVIVFEYQGHKTSFPVTVEDKRVAGVSITQMITKTDYLVGDAIDTAGGFIFVVYDDEKKTNQTLPMSAAKLEGYNNNIPGEQTVTVIYGDIAASSMLTVTFHSREKVDALISQIDSLDLNTISANDYEKITKLVNDYNSMADYEKVAITNISKLNEAKNRIDSLGAVTGNSSGNVTTSGTDTNKEKTSVWKIVFIIIAVIVIISVISGGVFFLILYLKRKRDDKTEFYYSEEDDIDGTLDSLNKTTEVAAISRGVAKNVEDGEVEADEDDDDIVYEDDEDIVEVEDDDYDEI